MRLVKERKGKKVCFVRNFDQQSGVLIYLYLFRIYTRSKILKCPDLADF